jgi:hypothetical protein
MIKRQEYQEDRKYNDQKTKITGGQTIQWSCYFCLLVIVLSILLIFLSFGHCIVCPPVMFEISGGQTIQWPKDKNNRRTDNTMTKRLKISGRQIIQWPKDKNIRRTDNTMTKRQK